MSVDRDRKRLVDEAVWSALASPRPLDVQAPVMGASGGACGWCGAAGTVRARMEWVGRDAASPSTACPACDRAVAAPGAGEGEARAA